MIRATICREGTLLMTRYYQDDARIQRADGRWTNLLDIAPCTPATTAAHGVGINGGLRYTAKRGGSAGNALVVRHQVGDVGSGHVDRPLTATYSEGVLTITFGTNGLGLTVVPTAVDVMDLVNGEEEFPVKAALLGSGIGVLVELEQQFQGGADDGDFVQVVLDKPYSFRFSSLEQV